MRHIHTRKLQYVVDPATGRRWPIPAGGSDDGPAGDEPPEAGDGTGEPAGGAAPQGDGAYDKPDDVSDEEWSALGDPGKQALVRTKESAKQARQKAADEAARAAALQAQIDELKNASESDTEKLVREATEQATKNVTKQANARIISAEVRAQAAGKLADPADAIKFLDLTKFEADDTGAVDEAAISAAIDQLVESKPYLAPQRRDGFQGTADGGARKDASKPSQLTEDDVKRMSSEQIEEARIAGRLDTYLSTPG